MDLVRQSELFETNRNLEPVGCRVGIEFKHREYSVEEFLGHALERPKS
jgi:hypothetical protein